MDRPQLTPAILVSVNSSAEQIAELQALTGLEVIEQQRPQCLTEPGLVLWHSPDGLALQQTGSRAPGPVLVDFIGGAVGHRRKYGGGKSQAIAKAVGIRDANRTISVLDPTAGLGRDAFILAALGARVTLVERSPIVRALLMDGLQRAANNEQTQAIVARVQLLPGHGPEVMQTLDSEDEKFDVVYLDPMFPHRDKSAAVKKEMVLLQALLGPDADADELLAPALAIARHRVVVKRPKRAPDLAAQAPGYRLAGKSGRFDIYPIKGF